MASHTLPICAPFNYQKCVSFKFAGCFGISLSSLKYSSYPAAFPATSVLSGFFPEEHLRHLCQVLHVLFSPPVQFSSVVLVVHFPVFQRFSGLRAKDSRLSLLHNSSGKKFLRASLFSSFSRGIPSCIAINALFRSSFAHFLRDDRRRG